MKLLYVVGLLLAIGINDIARINTLKQEAKAAYEAGDYETALEKYQELTDDLEVSTDEISLNMAHAHYHLQDTADAIRAYNELSVTADDNKIKSVAFNQVGVLHNEMDPSGKNDQAALNAFKAALKADPTNAEARYNYEVLKKKMKEKEEQENKDQQDQDQDNKDENKENEQEQDKDQKGDQDKEDQNSEEKEQENQEDQEKKDGEEQENKEQEGQEEQEKKEGEEQESEEKEGDEKDGEEKDEKSEQEKQGEEEKKDGMPQSAADKLKEMNISPQQAKMLLEAMKDQEVQYLQQLRRRPTKKRQSGKPDW